MTVGVGEQHFQTRHRVIDKLRVTREQGLAIAVSQTDVWALLEEVDRLQLVAQAANNLEAFALHGFEERKTFFETPFGPGKRDAWDDTQPGRLTGRRGGNEHCPPRCPARSHRVTCSRETEPPESVSPYDC
jgi:hypothetical protein